MTSDGIKISCSTKNCTNKSIVYKKETIGYLEHRIYYCSIHYLTRCKGLATKGN